MVVWDVRDAIFLTLEQDYGEAVPHADLCMHLTMEGNTFKGKEPRTQVSDVHYHSTSYGEFNWRFVWRNLGVRKGFACDALLTVGLYEKRVFGGDHFMAEGVIDLKPYLDQVSQKKTAFTIEAEV